MIGRLVKRLADKMGLYIYDDSKFLGYEKINGTPHYIFERDGKVHKQPFIAFSEKAFPEKTTTGVIGFSQQTIDEITKLNQEMMEEIRREKKEKKQWYQRIIPKYFYK